MKLIFALSICCISIVSYAQEVNVELEAPIDNIFTFSTKFGERGDSGYLIMYRFINPSPDDVLNRIVLLDSSGNPIVAASSTQPESQFTKIIGLSNGDFIYSSKQLLSFSESTPWIIQKFDSSFNEIWNYSYLSDDLEDTFYLIHAVEGAQGNIYLLSRKGENRAVILKLNPDDGAVIWSKGLHQSTNGNSEGNPLELKLLADGNVCVVGTAGGGENTNADFSISVVTPEGELIFSKALGEDSTVEEVAKSVVELENGDLMLIGYHDEFGLIVKVSSEGELIWVKKYSGDIGRFYSSRVLADNRVEIYGEPQGFGLNQKLIISEDGAVESSMTYLEGRSPMVINKINGQSVLLTKHESNIHQLTVLNANQEFESCFSGESPNVIVSDYLVDEYDLDHMTLDYYASFSHENILNPADIFLASEPCLIAGIEEGQKIADIKLVPNPAVDRLELIVSGPSPSSIKLEIYDLLGNQVYSQIHSAGKAIDISRINNGLYLAVLSTNEVILMKEKLLITK